MSSAPGERSGLPLGGLGRPGRLERWLWPGIPATLRHAAARLALARTARLPERALAEPPSADWLFCLARAECAR